MKKYIIKLFLLTATIFFAVSCSNNTEDPIFSESASERMKTAINKYSELLKSSENGWILEYYPEKNQVYGGYNYTIKFSENKISTVSIELTSDVSSTRTSTYDIISYGGPVLTFNTYNTFMHYFSNPSSKNYQALQGDYEFSIISNDENSITLKGMKSGNIMKLTKLTETPDSYLAKVKDVNDFLSGASYFKDGIRSDEPIRNLTFKEGNNDLKTAYVVTDRGIKLYKTITLEGNNISEFILDKTKKQLVSTNGNIVLDIVSSPLDLKQEWIIDTSVSENVSTSFKSSLDNANASNYNFLTLNPKINFGFIPRVSNTGIVFVSTDHRRFEAIHTLNLGGVLGAPNQIEITKGESAGEWRFFTFFQPMVNFIVENSPYVVEKINESKTKLTSSNNPNVWFILNK